MANLLSTENMKTIKVQRNQSLRDIALQYYGNLEAVGEILNNNPDLKNDPTALSILGIDALSDDGFYLDVALLSGTNVWIDTESPLMLQSVLKNLTREITTYDDGTNNR